MEYASLSHEELLARWPRDADGQPEAPALLVSLMNESALFQIMLLEAYGIPVLQKHGITGVIGRFPNRSTHLYVPASLLDEAQALLDADIDEPDAP